MANNSTQGFTLSELNKAHSQLETLLAALESADPVARVQVKYGRKIADAEALVETANLQKAVRRAADDTESRTETESEDEGELYLRSRVVQLQKSLEKKSLEALQVHEAEKLVVKRSVEDSLNKQFVPLSDLEVSLQKFGLSLEDKHASELKLKNEQIAKLQQELAVNASTVSDLLSLFKKFGIQASTLLEAEKAVVIYLESQEKKCSSDEGDAAHEVNKKLLAASDASVTQLKRVINTQAPLYKSGKTIALGEWEKSKRIHKDGKYISIWNSDDEADVSKIDARNVAVHNGDVIRDLALFKLGFLKSAKDTQHLVEMYGVPQTVLHNISSNIIKSTMLIYALNMRATMSRCYAWTEHTHCKEDDKEFKRLVDDTISAYNSILKASNTDHKLAAKTFDQSTAVESMNQQMGRIMGRNIKLHIAFIQANNAHILGRNSSR